MYFIRDEDSSNLSLLKEVEHRALDLLEEIDLAEFGLSHKGKNKKLYLP
ncbi:MAG TPA: hypothetical protein GXX19_03660 [Syntrophomonadaceae bacterium]|nr:hypothetical protein [Syntrophomonadaceae bacterium]